VPGAQQEWIDEGGLYDRDPLKLEEQINGFEFTYCSSEFDPNGIGGTYVATFYDDNICCAGPSAWPNAVCAYDLAGLPLSPDGNLSCWTVSVDLTAGFECPPDLRTSFPTEGVPDINGAPRYFSWGGTWDVNNTGPWIMRGGYRRDNSFTWFDTTTGGLAGCFWFGGFPFASFAMKIFGNWPGVFWFAEPGWQPFEGRVTLSAPVVAGTTVSFVVDFPGTEADFLLASLNPGLTILPSGRYILVDLGTPRGSALIGGTPRQMTNHALTVTLPSRLPPQIYLQVIRSTGGLTANAINGVTNGIKVTTF